MTTPQTVSDWLIYMSNIHVSAIDMGLERVLPVAQKLGILKDDLPKKPYVFTVAGTNGKGSTTALISDICTKAGYKTALYQSPHLVSFNERIKINGNDIDDELLIKAFTQCEQARTWCNLSLSFFEMTTLSAFWIFKELGCDVWVLEIGLGGRLDVVNLIDPDVCVITNVGIDHTDWLGDDREKIGFEKAGIIRDGTPVIYGEADMPQSVLGTITQKKAPYYQYTKDYAYTTKDKTWLYSNGALTISLPIPQLSIHNASTALSAILASNLLIEPTHIHDSLNSVQLAGRFDRRMIDGRQWVFDVGHNAHGVSFLMRSFVPFWEDYLRHTPDAKLHALFSMLIDKDIEAVLTLMNSFDLPIQAWHIAKIDNVRAMPILDLAKALQKNLPNSTIITYDSLKTATQDVLQHSKANDMILCFGSFYTISESLIALGLATNPKDQ